ncbi:twin-arginine translocation signal domain-containing protein [Haloterrigena sp. SYSU A558-1]|uniref:Twin-arginine translocation signal domain-containing protein n=1 Tax=Haloterrigena gelatinilytica TaxID=2741724 RepID=A0A8J8GRW6_9EURY|nr:twin-arginine translocation signal domain-containing protein [Haloterrigena gelatinilytica]NUB92837.1 twin-arginine translocation signal domain-containing protein [Haloterrigena gelatinilytica]NUC71251.1 twin-arginine translocation signal domain-containing protein [Haloterrigena gelatinilytica]
MSDELSRRTFIRSSSATAATVGLAGLAGCTSSLPFLGSDGADLSDWVFTPSFDDVLDNDDAEVEDLVTKDRSFVSIDPEAVYENEDELETHVFISIGSSVRGRSGAAAVDTDWALRQSVEWEYELSTSGSGTADVSAEIVAGEFDTGTVVDNLEKWADDQYENTEDEEVLESAGSQPGFELYEVEGYAFGVSEEHLIQVEANHPVDAVAVVEAAIDARENETGRWTEDDDGEELLAEFDWGDFGIGGLQRPETVETELEDRYDDPDQADEEEREAIEDDIDDWEYGLVGNGSSWTFDGDTSDITQVFLYESESDADSDALLEHVEANRDYDESWDTLEEYSISEEGRALVLTGTVQTQSIL